jgi:hypothetical protein
MTDFYDRMFKQRDDFTNRNDMANWYGDQKFTGVATWDQKVNGRDVKFGDVWDNGRLKYNLLDKKSGFSEQEAYTILGDLTLEKQTREHAYKNLDTDPQALKREVMRVYEETGPKQTAAMGAQASQKEVDQLKDSWDDTPLGNGVAATLAGAAGGAGVGLIAGPWGAVGGGIIGGLGGLLNQDSLEDQAARASIQTGQALRQGVPDGQEDNILGAVSTGLKQWGGVALSSASPLTNLLHGGVDMSQGKGIGDNKVGWYEMDRSTPEGVALTGLGLAATLGDSLLQFGSGAGTALYLGATGASVAGGVGQLASMGGATWDDRRGGFHSPENFGQWASAIGGVAIDAVQMGGGAAIASAARQGEKVLGRAIGDDVAAASAQARGTQHLAGREFRFDDAGRVASVRPSMQLVAPSEAVQWASVRVQANTMRAKAVGAGGDVRAVSKDDFNQMLYTAALDMSHGSRTAKVAFVNAFGEGTEEAVQAVLEPLSHDWTPEYGNVAESFLMGAAAGAGMSVGARVGRASQDTKDFHRANAALGLQGMPKIETDAWKQMSREQKQSVKMLPAIVERDLQESAARVAESMVHEVVTSEAGIDRLVSAQIAKRDQELTNANPALEGTYRISGLPTVEVPNHHVQTSLNTTLKLIRANEDGLTLRAQDQTLEPAERAEIELILQAHGALNARLTPLLHEVEATTSRDELDTVIGKINSLLQEAWDSTQAQGGAMAKAVGVILSRSPNNSDGSFQMLLPQVLPEATESNSDGLLQVSQAILKAIDGDWDGDTMKQHAALRPVQFRNDIAQDAVWRSFRLGQNFLSTTDGTPKIGVRAYEERELRAVAEDLLYGTDLQRDNAKAFLSNMDGWLRTAFSKVPNIDAIVKDYLELVRTGTPKSKEYLLRRLATEGADAMLEISLDGVPGYLTPMSNPYLVVDQRLNVLLQSYQESSAPIRTADRKVNIHSNPQPLLPGTPVAERAAVEAALTGITLHQAIVGTDGFRAPQHLHYSALRAQIEAAGHDVPTELDSLVMLYELINAGMRTPANEEIFTHDDIGQRAMRALLSYTKEFNANTQVFQTAALVAGLQVPNYAPDDAAGFRIVDGHQSMAQFILKQVADAVEMEHRADGTWEEDENLQTEVGQLRSMAPGDAWFRILGDVRAFALTGNTSNAFAANLTANQIRADYLNKTPLAREDYRDRVKMDVRYPRGKSHNLPYSMDEVVDKTVSEYSIFADALFESADNELSFDPTTRELHGRKAKRDSDMLDNVEDSLKAARLAVERLAGELYKNRQLTRDGKLDYNNLARILDANPDFARSLLNLIQDDVAHIVLRQEDGGKIGFQRWFLEMLLEENPAEQAMMYFRGTFLAQLSAHNAVENPRDSDDRLVRLYLELRTEPARAAEFQKKLFEAKDVRDFMRWVNTTHLTGAPQLAWFRDAAEFDSSQTKGGWSRSLPGAELREAITKFSRESLRFYAFAEQEILQDMEDASIITQLGQALSQLENGLETDASPLVKDALRHLEMIGALPQGLGPMVMRKGPVGLAFGIFGSATDKGKAADPIAPLAHDQARAEVMHQETGYEQLVALLTSHDADSVAQNPQVLAQRDIRMMDNDGRTAEWTPLKLRQLVDLWKDPENRPALRAALFPSTWEVQVSGSLAQQHLTGTSLKDLLSGVTYERMLSGRSFQDDLNYASMVDALGKKYGTTYAIQRRVTAFVLAQQSAARYKLSIEDVESMVDDIYRQYTKALRVAAEFRDDPKIAEAINTALNDMQQERQFGRTSPELVDSIKKDLLASTEQVSMQMTPEEADFLDNRKEALETLFGTDTFEKMIRAYTINWDDPQDVKYKKRMLAQLVHDKPNFVEAIADRPEISHLRSLSMTDDLDKTIILHPNPEADQEAWDAVAQQVLSVMFDTVETTASTNVPSALAAKEMTAKLIKATDDTLDRENLGNAQFWDPSYRYLIDHLLNPDSAELQAAAEFRDVVLGKENYARMYSLADFTDAIGILMDPSKYGPWTSDIARMSVDAMNRFDSSGAGRQVASSGISYAKQAALSRATTNTFADPGAAVARTYTIAEPQLKLLRQGEADLFAPGGLAAAAPGAPMESLALLNGRFVTEVHLSYREKNGSPASVDLLADPAVRVKAAQSYVGQGATKKLPYKATNIDLLLASVNSILPEDASDLQLDVSFFHPQDQPASPDFANNLFFEGLALPPSGNHYNSQIEALWLSDDGLNVFDQTAALKANKKGLLSLRNPALAAQEAIMALEDPADVYGTLQRKLAHLMTTSLGHKVLEPIYAPAVFKDLKMRHALRVTTGDTTMLLSADQAIALQAKGPIDGELELVTISPRVLRTLLGEQDLQGVTRAFTDAPTVNSAGVTVWTNDLQALAEERMPGLLEIGTLSLEQVIKETRIGRRSALAQSTVRPALTREQRAKFADRASRWERKAEEVEFSRIRTETTRKRLVDNREQGLAMINQDRSILSDMGHFALRDMGLKIDLPVGIDVATDKQTNEVVRRKFTEAIAFRDTATINVYSHDGTVRGERRNGVIHNISQFEDPNDHESKAHTLIRGDGLVVRIDSFAGIADVIERLATATAVVKAAAERGVHIILATGNPKYVDIELRYQLGPVLEAVGYKSVAGAPGVWTPLQEADLESKTLEARNSRLLEVRHLDSASHVAVFNATRGVNVEESAALINNIHRKDGREVALARDLAPTMAFSGFNTAVTNDQKDLVRRTLAAYQQPEKLDHLLKLTDKVTPAPKKKLFSRDKPQDERKKELEAALVKALDNLDTNGLPRQDSEFAPGDIIALVGPKNQVILYRHGFEPIKSDKMLREMLAEPDADGTAGRIAIYGATPLEDATTHTGTIIKWNTTPGYGLVLEERIPLQALGNKTVLERNGMKLVGISMDGSGVQLPEFGPLSRWEIDYIMSWEDSLSKENYDGTIRTARNAIGYLGFDFVGTYAKTLFNVSDQEYAKMSLEDRRSLQSLVKDFFTAIGRREKLSILQVDAMQRTLFSVDPIADATVKTILGDPLIAPFIQSDRLTTLERADWTPEDMATVAAILYMQSPGANADHVLGAAGFGPEARKGTYQSFLPPELFTSVFDRAPLGSELRTWFFDTLNRQMYKEPAAPKKRQTGYHLAQDWTFTVLNEDPSKNLEGYLQFSEAHSTGDNPTLSNMAMDRSQKQNVSRQQTLVAEQSLGADFASAKDLKKTKRYIKREGVKDVTTTADLFEMMNGGTSFAPQPKHSRVMNVATHMALENGRKERRKFQQVLNKTKWDAAQVAAYDKRVAEIMNSLGLAQEYAHMADWWVRMWALAPRDPDAATTAGEGWVTATHAMESLQKIQQNIAQNHFPTHGSMMPFMSFNETYLLAQAALANKGSWRPEGVNTESDFYHAALGMIKSKFDPAFRVAADGFLQSFRNAGEDFASMQLTVDEVRDLDLLDPQTNELILTWNRNQALNLDDPIITDAYNALLTDLFDGQQAQDPLIRSNRKMRKWREDTDQAQPVAQTLADYKAQGARFVHYGTTTSSLMRILTDLRAANGMFNPFLYAVAPLEYGIRNILEDVSSIVTGDGTTGLGAKLNPDFDPVLAKAANTLYSDMGRNQGFKGMMYRELVTRPKLHNANKVEKLAHMLAQVGGSWQDPSYGMFQKTMAKRYVESVIRHVVSTGSQTTLTPRRVIEILSMDPEGIQKALPEAHRYAMNTIANVRSLKPTMASLVYKSFLDPLKANGNIALNVPANLTNITTLFLPYAMNVATNMLGLQGLNAMTAVLASGRGGKKMGKMQAWLQGVEYDPAIHGVDFVAETLESVDLADAFIRSGMTHTALMGLGLLGQSLGLTGGGDEEERRRRRAEEFAGVGHLYDPRDIANDFRNADAIFFDNLPEWIPFAGNLKELFEVQGPEAPGGSRSMAQLHWTLKQFISPMMGMERFINTGDFRQVLWGFEDALGSMPLVNASSWDEAATVSAELASNAAKEGASGNPEDMANGFGFLFKSVMTLERMLFENAFVNSIYQSIDKYDRDPWTVVDVDSEGKIVRDNTDVPMDTLAMQQYLDDNKNVALSDIQHSEGDVAFKRLGEQRVTLAFFGSLFTGFDTKDSLWRYDMAAKTRKVEKTELTADQQEALILSQWDPSSKREVLTMKGAEAILKGLHMGTVKPGDPALDNVFISFEDRKAISDRFMARMKQDYLDAGLPEEKAQKTMEDVFYGRTNPYAKSLFEAIWSKGDFEKSIPFESVNQYRQLNTTYVMGPDGMPWATGLGRNILGNFWGMNPLQRYNGKGDGSNLTLDNRLNATDEMANLNTGMRNLEKVHSSWANPTDEAILKAIQDGLEKVRQEVRHPGWTDYAKKGFTPYGRSGGYSRGGGGYGGGGGGYAYKLNGPERNNATYGSNDPYIRVDNPIIRRASIRRERFSSTRGRLNQWQ